MMVQTKIAGFLTAFGLVGLAMAPFILTPAPSIADTAARPVSLAITFGPQLRLLRSDDTRTAALAGIVAGKNMVCSSVYNLQIAEVGLHCRQSAALRTVASISR